MASAGPKYVSRSRLGRARAARRVYEVLPRMAVRQRVLSLPCRLGYLLAGDHVLSRGARRVRAGPAGLPAVPCSPVRGHAYFVDAGWG